MWALHKQLWFRQWRDSCSVRRFDCAVKRKFLGKWVVWQLGNRSVPETLTASIVHLDRTYFWSRACMTERGKKNNIDINSDSYSFSSCYSQPAHSKCLTESLRKASLLRFPWQLACIGIDDISWSPTYFALKMLSQWTSPIPFPPQKEDAIKGKVYSPRL